MENIFVVFIFVDK